MRSRSFSDSLPALSLLFLILHLHAPVTLAAAPPASRWEPEIARFEEEDRRHPPRPGGILFYGSSTFRLWKGLTDAFPGLTVPIVNRGFGGSHLSDLIDFVDRVVLPHAPRVLFIYGGDNDLAGDKSPDRVLEDFKTLVTRVHAVLPRTRIVFVAVKPSPSREKFLAAQQEANAQVRRYARSRRRVEFVDLATPLLDAHGRPEARWFVADRLHLNAEGYVLWRDLLAPRLQRWTR